MCQKNYNTNKKEKKYTHINYTERTQIERWYNIEHKSKVEIAHLLNKSERTIRREIEEYGLKFKTRVCAKTIRNCNHKGEIFEITEKDMIYNKEYKDKNEEKRHCEKVPVEKKYRL